MSQNHKANETRDFEAEREALLETMRRYVSEETEREINLAIRAMKQPEEYLITVSHTGAASADDK